MKTVPAGIKELLEGTYNQHVKSKVGDYAGVYELGGTQLVCSTDGVGTKIRVACEDPATHWTDPTAEHEVIGGDLVNHCVNDILVAGARPLFFLNCFSYSSDDAKEYMQPVLKGMTKAAMMVDMPIISGETAKMEGFYPNNTYDIVGTIVGIKDIPLRPERIAKGDKLIGIPSLGPHTNGYTLIRKIFTSPERHSRSRDYWLWIDDITYPRECLGMTVREAVMQPHRCYYGLVAPLANQCCIHAVAHVTGGGIETNLNRVVGGHKFQLDWPKEKWPRLYHIIQFEGSVSEEEMRKQFNLGIGLVLVVSANSADRIWAYLKTRGEQPQEIGEIL
jgi:phosphoribosylformylglycinamidine cyclo-ligase